MCNIYFYIICWILRPFLLVLSYDRLEDRRIDGVIIGDFSSFFLYKTNRFHVAVRLFSNRSKMTSKCGKNISDTRLIARVSLFCSYHISTPSVIYYWTDARQHGIYLLNRQVSQITAPPPSYSRKQVTAWSQASHQESHKYFRGLYFLLLHSARFLQYQTYLSPATPCTMRLSLVNVPVLSKQHTSTFPANGILNGSVQYTPTGNQYWVSLDY